MNKLFTLSLSLLLSLNIIAQTIDVSDNLELIELSENCYIHTCNYNNGMVFINDDKALVVSTPDSDIETQNLIDWVIEEKNAEIVAYVIDRWHPDAMEGLDVVHENGIKTFSNYRTIQIAKNKELPIPQNGFSDSLDINVGGKNVICYYFGAAHTNDGIVVWVPSEKVLFAGNGIRNYNGWVGNIADAHLYDWSKTAKKIKDKFPDAEVVIPGHGKYGGTELIDYTITLYNIPDLVVTEENMYMRPYPFFQENQQFLIDAEKDTVIDSKRLLINAIVIMEDDDIIVSVKSDTISLYKDKLRLNSNYGQLMIYTKTSMATYIKVIVDYKGLIVIKEDDEVGLRVIVKEFIVDSR